MYHDKYTIDIKKGWHGCLLINSKLVEQTRRFLARTIWQFYHNDMGSKSGESFEQWHEDKAIELLAFLNMNDVDREDATKILSVSSSNPRRLSAMEEIKQLDLNKVFGE